MARRQYRSISVRFGIVLASNGSVVPKFKAQIEAGVVTVTHPDMVLAIYDDPRGLRSGRVGGQPRARLRPRGCFRSMLNMGQPVKIAQLAERMIRLSGLEPGRHRDRL